MIHHQNSKNIIIVASDEHIRDYITFLTLYLNFNDLYEKENKSKCIDVSDLEQPLFMKLNDIHVPRKKVVDINYFINEIEVERLKMLMEMYNNFITIKDDKQNLDKNTEDKLKQYIEENKLDDKYNTIKRIIDYIIICDRYADKLSTNLNFPHKIKSLDIDNGLYVYDENAYNILIEHFNALPSKYDYLIERISEYYIMLYAVFGLIFSDYIDVIRECTTHFDKMQEIIQSNIQEGGYRSELHKILDTADMKEKEILHNIMQIKNMQNMINEKDSNLMTPLQTAFERKFYNIAEYLIKNGAKIGSTDAKYIWYYPPKTYEDIRINNNLTRLVKENKLFDKYDQYNYISSEIPEMKSD